MIPLSPNRPRIHNVGPLFMLPRLPSLNFAARPLHGASLQCPPILQTSRGQDSRRDGSREKDRGEGRSRSGGSRRDRKERGKETPPRRARERDQSRSSSSSSGSRSHSVPSHRWPKLRSRSRDRPRDRQTRMRASDIICAALFWNSVTLVFCSTKWYAVEAICAIV